MAAEQNRVERLRHQCDHRSGQTEWYAIDYGELEALLAVVEAAQDFWQEMVGVKLDPQQTFHFDDLGTKLAALHTQASDDT